MSDTPQGGWWKAKDGKWYPPQGPPGIPLSPPDLPVPPTRNKAGFGVGVLVGLLAGVLIGGLAAALIGAGVAAAVVSSYYDSRSIGQRIDASLGAVERGVDAHVAKLEAGASVVDKVLFVADKLAGDQRGEPPYHAAMEAALACSLDAAADPARS